MAFIFGAVDPDVDRRRRFLDSAEAGTVAAEGLVRHRWTRGDLELVSLLAETTPVHEVEGDQGWTWVVGDIYAAEGTDPALYLDGLISDRGSLEVHGQGGYYLACTVDRSGGVTLGTDPLGLFPIFYASETEALLFSTLPGALHHHPACRPRPSAEGLAGVLLFSHAMNGQTIWEGIRQPEFGRAVVWKPGTAAQTVTSNPIVPTEDRFGMGYEGSCELLETTLRGALKRSTQGKATGLMLSGGLDSRLIAGHLDALGTSPPQAVVFGDSGDNEVRCAGRVARELGFPVLRLTNSFDRYPEAALIQSSEEHMSFTFYDFGWRTAASRIAAQCPVVANGFLGDSITGASLVPKAYDEQRGVFSFERQLASASAWGFSPEEVSGLVRLLPLGDAVQSCITKMRDSYASLPGLPFQKATLWGLYHRGRYHVGPYAWRLSRSFWSVMPFIDRQVLELGLGMPLDHVGRRRMQQDILRSRYRRLAKLPVDGNKREIRPLIESSAHRARRLLRSRLVRRSGRRQERRTYYRQFDINNPGWRSVRALAEPTRRTAHHVFHPNELARHLPSPEEDIVCPDPIIHSARLKTLLGLMLLSDRIAG